MVVPTSGSICDIGDDNQMILFDCEKDTTKDTLLWKMSEIDPESILFPLFVLQEIHTKDIDDADLPLIEILIALFHTRTSPKE